MGRMISRLRLRAAPSKATSQQRGLPQQGGDWMGRARWWGEDAACWHVRCRGLIIKHCSAGGGGTTVATNWGCAAQPFPRWLAGWHPHAGCSSSAQVLRASQLRGGAASACTWQNATGTAPWGHGGLEARQACRQVTGGGHGVRRAGGAPCRVVVCPSRGSCAGGTRGRARARVHVPPALIAAVCSSAHPRRPHHRHPGTPQRPWGRKRP